MEKKTLIEINGNGDKNEPKEITKYLLSLTEEERKNIVFRTLSNLIDFDVIIALNDFDFVACKGQTFERLD